MPSKKKKYNARFPSGRIKKIMQSDEEIGKVAQAVPVIISKTLELFVESLLTKTLTITNSRNAKTLSPSHVKQCIMSEPRFDFLRELVKTIPDIAVAEEAANYNEEDAADAQSSPDYPDSDTPFDLSMPSTSAQALARSSSSRASSSVASNVASAYTRSQSINDATQKNLSKLHKAALISKMMILPPAKLTRSESMPSAATHYQRSGLPRGRRQPPTATVTSATVTSATVPSATVPSATVPSATVPSATVPSATMISATSLKSKNTPANTRQIDTAIPETIVSYELNKPLVKIDYSNLNTIPNTTEPPKSAPPHIDPSNVYGRGSKFNFPTAPVFNIDLSNIGVGSNSKNVTPAIATISIGAMPPIPETTVLPKSSTSTATTKLTAISKVPFISPVHSQHYSVATIPPKPKASVTSTSNSFFELDEDYDNI